MKRYPLSDKVVRVTGAGGGLDAATVTALTRRGERVVIADIDRCTAGIPINALLAKGRSLGISK